VFDSIRAAAERRWAHGRIEKAGMRIAREGERQPL
jgi:hypothetical protein